MIHLPTAVGLKVCLDYIIQDKTRSVTLVNCASRFTAKSFPVQLRGFTVCGKLTDACGKMELSLVIFYLATMEEVFTQMVALEFRDRLQEYWVFLRVKRCPFPNPGRYQIVLSANGEFVAQCKIEMLLQETKP